MRNNKGTQLESAPCCDCSTIEGESELSTDQGTTNYAPTHYIPLLRYTPTSAPLHWCCDKRPCSGTALYMEQISAQPAIQSQHSVDHSHPPGKMYSMPYNAFAY